MKEIDSSICKETVFKRVYTDYSKSLHDYLYYKYGEASNPNDILQEAFIKLWNNCKKVPLGKAKSFLYTVVNNMVLNDIKHQKVILKYQQVPVKEYTNETPEFVLEQEEFMVRYKEALANLPADYRVAFLLNKVEQKKHREIAKLLGVTQKVVEYRIYSAFKALKEELEGFSLK